MFRDEAKIHVKGGDGGRGACTFRREKFHPMGGPDGGDGGDGGSVILEATAAENTLLTIARSPNHRAVSGEAGRGSHQTGRTAPDLVLAVPVGTTIKDDETGITLKDLAVAGDRIVIAKGGKGGRGNAMFRSSVNQTPRRFEHGRKGELRTLRLELRLIADVGLVGLPNAGKSTFISRVSRATPKIADYPFTTLDPHPGIVELSGVRRFVMMDIPGLIEGAHLGAGLGHRFLRHVERTRVLVHVIDLFPGESGVAPLEAYRVIDAELRAFSPLLAARPRIIVLSKCDIDPEGAPAAAAVVSEALGLPVLVASGVTGTGTEAVLEACWRLLHPPAD